MEYKTYNIELQMSDETRQHWMNLLSETRDAFNRCATLVTSSEIKLSLVPVHNLCYDMLRTEFPNIPSQGIIRVQKSVLAALRSIRSNKHKNADVPQKKSLSLQLDKRMYSNLSVLEDLKKIKYKTSRTKEGFKRIRHNNALSQVPLAEFREMLTHKATLAGKQVVSVSPTWTSQTDCRTGKRDGKRHGCRYYCNDGIVFDADWNAAVNIAQRANHPTSTILPIDGKMQALVGKAQSTASTSRT